jgi:xylulokinase
MGRSAFIGIDVGTSACKTVLLAADGAVIHTALGSYPTRRTINGEVTQRPADWLKAVVEGLRACSEHLGGLRVEAISVTAPAHAAVLVDESGEPLTPTLLAFDQRPAQAAVALRSRYGDELFKRTFVELSAGWTIAQLAWLRGTSPGIWPRIRWVMTQKDWIRFRLTDVVAVDASDAAGTAMMDQRARTWLLPVCADIGLSHEQLPPIVGSTEPAGYLSRRWARRTGLPAGIPFAAGATDTAAELISVGAVRAGSALVKIASTATVVGVSHEPVVDRRLLTYPHAIPGLWYTLGATNTAATAYQWLCRTALKATPSQPQIEYAAMDRLASTVPAGAEGVLFLPYLEGERTPFWDPSLRGAFVGLSSAHTSAHLARAVLEGVAFAVADCRDAIVAAGLPVERPSYSGGGAASRLWRQILASVLNTTGRLTDPQGPAIGAAVIAASIGATNASEVLRSWRPQRSQPVRPVPQWATQYAQLRPVYRDAGLRLKDISHRLIEVAQHAR